MKPILALLAAAVLLSAPIAYAQSFDDNPLTAPKPDIAATPPMGWNSWNHFHCDIDEAKIRAQADAMVSSGMRDAGYRYIIIDDCWAVDRNADGEIVADAKRFPSGIKALADYVHGKGLKFGIYSDAGGKTCENRPGGSGHEYQDARTYAAWGVDYLKYDWCHAGTANAADKYGTMAQALRTSGRDIVLSICEWGINRPRDWAPDVGHLWRTTGDITDDWADSPTSGSDVHGVMDILDAQADLWRDSGPNHWNDPDMLEVGNGKMSDTEYRAHFSLWAMLAAPLIAGNDLAGMRADTRTILTNRDVIAVDQDSLGIQGHRAWKSGDYEVWIRPLKDGDRAVILLNRSTTPHSINVDWPALGWPEKLKADAHDLWSKVATKKIDGHFSAEVPGHGVVMIRLTPQV